jgi:GNAT superfamily N-acetyltransferase
MLRDGRGGGQRVSAATTTATPTCGDIEIAETGMAQFKQRALFMVRPEDAALDCWLASRNYEIVDPVVMYLCGADDLTHTLPPVTAMPVWPPLAIQREIWWDGGICEARFAVMERVIGKKTAILGRLRDTPAATAFVALDGDIAMIHALEVRPDCRRAGLGRRMMQGAANWAAQVGAQWIALAVTRANAPANALYSALGMSQVASYHYRRVAKAPS